MVQPPRAGIAHVRVDTEIPAALPGGLLLVKGLERAAQSVPSGGGIDHERVHNENFLIRRFKLPRRTGVYIDLYLIQNSGRRDASIQFRNEDIAARERGLRRSAHGIDPALPAGRGASGLFFGDNGIIYGGHSVNIGRRGLSEGNWHGILLCLN